MSKVLQLMETRNKAVAAARAFLDGKGAVSDVLSAEDEAVYAKMEEDIQSLTRAIERESKLAAIEDNLKQPTSQPIVNTPQKPESAKTGRASDEYRRDFMDSLRGRPITNTLSVGVDADGGYLVPTEFENQIVKGLNEANVIRGIAKTISTNVERKVPIAATGSTATWVAENGTIPVSEVKFGQKTLDAFKLTDQIKVSNELLQDSMFNIESYLSDEFARALGVAEEEAFCVGDGAGKPTGIFRPTSGGKHRNYL